MSATNDVVDLILSDHRELQRLFAELLDSPEKRPTLVPVMTTLLTAHSRAEESEVYPAARAAGGEEDVERSQKEHLEADQLALRVSEADPASDEFTDLLQQLVEAVRHHLKEEEETVLPGLRKRLDEQRLATLGEAFLSVRAERLGTQPADITRDDLRQQADNVGISGVSQQRKPELKKTLAEQAER